MSKLRPGTLVGALAALCGTAGVWLIVRSELNGALPVGLCAHGAAAWLALWAARRRRPDLSQTERDTVLLTALFVPLFGPAMAPYLPAPDKEQDEEAAKEIFDRYKEYIKPQVPDYERSLFTGDIDKDLARELDVESYTEVLSHGSTDQKRNALKALADLGEPKHLALVRACIKDPEHEVRLYAYGELSRVSRPHEERIDKQMRKLQENADDVDASAAAADAHFCFAFSGILDPGMAAFHYKEACKAAAHAAALGAPQPGPAILAARSWCGLRDLDQAVAALEALEPVHRGVDAVRVVRAEIAYLQRDFDAARAEAHALRDAGADVPEWLQALVETAEAGA